MVITKVGNTIKGFKFVCKCCGAEWYADRDEAKITPPFMEYAVYMNCPCCKNCTTAEKE